MNIDKLINEVIPPDDYQHRNGFNNIPIIDKLTSNEKQFLEKALVQRLQSEEGEKIDTLIVETLAYLKSISALPVLKNLLEVCSDPIIKLRVATAIFEINQDEEMTDIAISSARKLDSKKSAYYVYELSNAFDYLAKFKSEKTKHFISEYTSHPEYLIAYNAKRALGKNS